MDNGKRKCIPLNKKHSDIPEPAPRTKDDDINDHIEKWANETMYSCSILTDAPDVFKKTLRNYSDAMLKLAYPIYKQFCTESAWSVKTMSELGFNVLSLVTAKDLDMTMEEYIVFKDRLYDEMGAFNDMLNQKIEDIKLEFADTVGTA